MPNVQTVDILPTAYKMHRLQDESDQVDDGTDDDEIFVVVTAVLLHAGQVVDIRSETSTPSTVREADRGKWLGGGKGTVLSLDVPVGDVARVTWHLMEADQWGDVATAAQDFAEELSEEVLEEIPLAGRWKKVLAALDKLIAGLTSDDELGSRSILIRTGKHPFAAPVGSAQTLRWHARQDCDYEVDSRYQVSKPHDT